jgi:NAD+ kinase
VGKKAKLKNVCIVLKPKLTSEFNNTVPTLVSWLRRRSVKVFFKESQLELIKKIVDPTQISTLKIDDNYSEVDLIVTLGGDGTLIGISRQANKNTPPVFGVNMGHLGFITEFSKSELYDELENTLMGNFQIIKVNLFKVEVSNRNGKKKKYHFINDAVFNQSNISRLVTVRVKANDEPVYSLSGDGLIISSPIGSTAYSLAAGGPIIFPDVKSVVLTPICPHSLNHRPLVLPPTTNIEVRPGGRNEQINLTLDGQEAFSLLPSDIVNIKINPAKYIKFIKNENKTYFHTLKTKFTHGRREG